MGSRPNKLSIKYLQDSVNRPFVSIGWEISLVAAIVFLCFWVPFEIAFEATSWVHLLIIDMGVTLLVIIDDQVFERREQDFAASKGVRRAQMLAAAPLYGIAALAGWRSEVGAVLLLSHLIIIPFLYQRLKFRFRASLIGKGLKSAFLLGAAGIVIHWLACVWHNIHPSDGELWSQYIHSLYWSITTVTTVGYGDVTPATDGGKLFAMCAMLLGVGFYGVIIGQVSSYLTQQNKRAEEQKEQLEVLDNMLKHYNVPADLVQESIEYLRYQFERSTSERESQMLGLLPEVVQKDIRTHMLTRPLGQLRLFSNCSTECLLAASELLSEEHVRPGERIISTGEKGDRLFLIGFGKVKVHREDDLIAILSNGDCFGEMALVHEDTRVADVTAVLHCDLFSLNRSDFESLTRKYPELLANTKALVQNRAS